MEHAHPTEVNAGAADQGAVSIARKARPLTPRVMRLLRTLLTGPTKREDLDRAVGCSNSPHYVIELRAKFGIAVPCTMLKGIDREGRAVEFGQYALVDGDFEKARALLAEASNDSSQRINA